MPTFREGQGEKSAAYISKLVYNLGGLPAACGEPVREKDRQRFKR